MKKSIVVGVLLAAVMLAVKFPPAFCRTELIDRIIARVNEEIITQRQYNEQKEKLRQSLAQHYSGEQLDAQYNEGVKDLLENMIDEDLFVQKAKDLNINVESQLVQRLDQLRQQMGLASIQDL
ncbi:MAG: SurA N-terminal domain-containing protein, partial [Terriglobia bacterium]